MTKNFAFVIAKPWDKSNSNNLCIYTYGAEIQHGSTKAANTLLEYVQRTSNDTEYSIYKINFEKVE